jgi:DnaJ family protein A protein 2
MFGGIPFGAFGGGGFRTVHIDPETGMPAGMGGMGGGEPEKDVDTEGLYKALGLEKGADAKDIKKAYVKLVRKLHPDKGGDPEEFKKVQKAYDILGDAEKRELYDKYGEEGVENGGGPSSAEDMFAAFFGGGRGRPSGPRKGDPTRHPLRVSLEDLYKGKTVRLDVPKSIYKKDPSGNIMDRSGNRYTKTVERKMLEVFIEKGMKHGQRITFENAGDELPGQLPGDVVFIVQQKEHAVFHRKGSDLIMKKEISLVEALTGTAFVVNHLDGRKVFVSSKPGEVIGHESVREVPEEGMPVYGHSHVKGSLFVHFEIKWPESLELTEAKARALKGILPGPSTPLPVFDDEVHDAAELAEPDMDARKGREALARDAAESDDEGGPGMQRVQCAQQ